MTLWQVITQERNGAELADLVDLRDRKFDFVLNGVSEISGRLDTSSPRALRSLLTSGVHEAKALRSGDAQETVFQLDNVRPASDDDGGSLDLHWSGVISYLHDALVLSGTSQSTGIANVAWNLIDAYQLRTGGNYGFTRGVYPATDPTYTRTWDDNVELFGQIAELSELADGGFDFTINTDRQFDTWTERGSDNGLVLEYGGNVLEFDYEESTSPGLLVNALTARNKVTVVSVTDSTSITTYGRREAVTADEEDTSALSQLTQWANGQIATTKSPLIIPAVKIDPTHPSCAWGSYWLGDTVTFRGKLGNYVDIDDLYRIVAIHVEVDDDDNETITLELNLA